MAFSVATGAFAAVRDWVNAGGGNWEVGGNWNTGAPTNLDDARIFSNGTYTVFITNSTADTAAGTITNLQDISMGNSAGDNQTLVVNYTNTPVLSFRILNVGFGNGATPTFLLEQGAVESRGESHVGQIAGSVGTFIMNGGSLTVTNSLARWTIGGGGTGIMTMNGGLLTINRIFNIGSTAGGYGVFEVAGGTANISSSPIVANSANSTGTVIVSGGTLNLTNGNQTFTVGNNGANSLGTLIVSNGALNGYIVSVGNNSAFEIHGGTSWINRRVDLAQNAGTIATMTMSAGLLIATNSLASSDRNRIGNGGTGIFTQTGGESRFDSLSLGDSSGATGSWTLSGGTGTVTSSSFLLGRTAGSTGTVTVAGGTLNLTGAEAQIGVVGRGTLVTSNGTVNAQAVVLGYAGGAANSGTWNIFGGTNNLTGNLVLGRVDTAASRFLLAGGALNISNSSMNVGQQGYGGAIAIVSNGTLTVNKLSVGGAEGVAGGKGDMSFFGGLTIVTNTFRVAANTGGGFTSTGTVTVADSAILELRGATSVGAGGNTRGSITNRNGGTIRFTALNNPSITVNAGSSFVTTNATIEFKDATAANLSGSISTAISYAGNNTLRLNTATNNSVTSYTFQTNSAPTFAHLDLQNGGRFQASSFVSVGNGGSITGNGTVAAPVSTNSGTISPGNSAGLLTFAGDLNLQPTSVLALELGGTSGSQYDQVDVTGLLTADGTLNVTLINAFNPANGDSFDILDFGSLAGTFSTTSLPTLDPGLAWDTSALYSTGTLSVYLVIPEPSTVALLLFAGAVLWRRSRP
jgi:hypothetical protein